MRPFNPLDDLRRTAILLGRARVVIGLALLIAPGRAARVWAGGPGADNPSARLFARATGVREVAMGMGTAISAAGRQRPADWISIAAIADFGDGVISLTDRRAGWGRRAIGVFAILTSVAHLAAARALAAEAGSDART